VASALRHFDGSRYALLAWVVMDDHVHAVAHVHDGWTLEAIMHSWKSYTAHVLQRDHGRLGSVWLEEYYDRLIRDETDLREKMRYVVTNPERRWPGAGDYAWAWCLGMDEQDA
jgi:REP element-mobilizing transposase RayT